MGIVKQILPCGTVHPFLVNLYLGGWVQKGGTTRFLAMAGQPRVFRGESFSVGFGFGFEFFNTRRVRLTRKQRLQLGKFPPYPIYAFNT